MGIDEAVGRRTFLQRAGLVATLAAGGGLVPLLDACSTTNTATTTSSAPVKGGKAVFAMEIAPVNMDPADAQLYASMQVYQNIFHKLINVDSNFKFIPGLATKWVQDDPLTWTLDLVDNAVFHNGEPFTANDVKFTFDRVRDHPNGIFYSAWKETEVLGPHKVRFHLSQPYGAFEASLAGFGDIVNEKAVKGADPRLNPVGTGPYKMAEWVQGDHVKLVRWDKFFKPDRPYLDEITFKAIVDDSVRLTSLQTGEVDFIESIPRQRVTELLSSNTIKSSASKPYLPSIILFNCSKPPFNDVRVRQAVAWAIDRVELVKLVWFGQAVTATEAVSQPNPWYSGQDPYQGGPDPARSKSLLKQAGQEGLKITFAGTAGVSYGGKTAEVLKSQLAKAGIQMDIQNYEPAQWFEQLATKKYDLTSTYWSASMDPAHMYFPLGYSKSPWNFGGISSSKIDDVLTKFVLNGDQQQRKAAYPDVVRTVAEEAPFIFIYNQFLRYWTKPKLSGPAPIPSLEVRAEDVWLSR